MNQSNYKLKYLIKPFILHWDYKEYFESTSNNSRLEYITIIQNVIVLSEDNDIITVSKVGETDSTETLDKHLNLSEEKIKTTKKYLFDDYYSAMKGMALICATYKIHEKDIFSITCSLMEPREYKEFLKEFYKNNPEIFI